MRWQLDLRRGDEQADIRAGGQGEAKLGVPVITGAARAIDRVDQLMSS